jgi:hypothetical protein
LFGLLIFSAEQPFENAGHRFVLRFTCVQPSALASGIRTLPTTAGLRDFADKSGMSRFGRLSACRHNSPAITAKKRTRRSGPNKALHWPTSAEDPHGSF